MENKIRDLLEYTIAIVSAFSEKYKLSEKQAYRYMSFHKGIKFIEEHYGILHTLDFNEAVDSVALYCRKSGGEL